MVLLLLLRAFAMDASRYLLLIRAFKTIDLLFSSHDKVFRPSCEEQLPLDTQIVPKHIWVNWVDIGGEGVGSPFVSERRSLSNNRGASRGKKTESSGKQRPRATIVELSLRFNTRKQ